MQFRRYASAAGRAAVDATRAEHKRANETFTGWLDYAFTPREERVAKAASIVAVDTFKRLIATLAEMRAEQKAQQGKAPLHAVPDPKPATGGKHRKVA